MFDRYRTFGLRKHWLEDFLYKLEDWFSNNTLGPVQFQAMKRYLKDANLIDEKGNITPLAKELSELYRNDEEGVWQIIWLNLCTNSELFKFYCFEIPWGEVWNKEELIEKIAQKGYSQRTARNAVNALTNTFENSPFGDWFGKKVEKKEYLKQGLKTLSLNALRYALEKLDGNEEKLLKIFGMNKSELQYNLMRLEI